MLNFISNQTKFLLFIFCVASQLTFADSQYGNCDILFARKIAPISPDEQGTPLCAEDEDNVFFATSYSKTTNHGIWSAYKLNPDQISEMLVNPLPRPNIKFAQSPFLKTDDYVQPRHDSYTNTKWDRGHLAPNGAMSWDEMAQRSSFSITNIAPQSPAMNRNIWRCFETSIREWAASDDVYVVAGTIGNIGSISSDKDPHHVSIVIPSHYIAMVYKTKPQPMAIGVMVPNEPGHLDVRDSIMSVNELEQRTGYKFGLPLSISKKKPDLKHWTTRVVKKELLGELPPIDQQCPRVSP